MKESKDLLKAKTLILTHGDSDGICSDAIVKSGDGHPFAAGARIPENSLDAFLRTFDEELGRASEGTVRWR